MVRVTIAALILLAGSGPMWSQPKDKEKEKDKKPVDDNKAPARLRFLLPADAKLIIDNVVTKSTGPERTFTTPPLPKGKSYEYTLRWNYNERDINITRMAIIDFKGGEEKTIDLRPGSKTVLSSRIIFVPTSKKIVNKMLEMAKVTGKDVVYDLGCGDGRIVVTAAKEFGAKGVGVDIDPERVKDSRANVAKEKVEKLVEIRQGDALKVKDISKATVVMLYMLPEFQEKLAPILKRELKPGTRVVAHDYSLPGWKEEASAQMQGPFRQHTLYLYRVGEEKKKKVDEEKKK
jgi:uncharacterized protein (TIGR03000 family)